jgi:Na+-driven multidrug efflux pump
MLIYVTLAVGSLIALTGILALRPIASLLGASGRMLEDCVLYGRIVLLALPAFMLQIGFQSFLVSAERPKLGLFITLASGVANMLLDALLVGILPLGLVGAALATTISQLIGGIVPLLYFAFPNKSPLRLTGFSLDLRALLRTCANGSSELMSNVSMSLVGMLYNVQLMKYEGENGVAAYGVLMYVSMIFMASFIGYIIGVAPIISYHYGAQNHDELKSLRKKSLRIILYASISMLVLGELLSQPLSLLFVSYDPKLYDLTLRGFFFYSFSYLFCGIAIFGSGFFTALNNGLVSAIISFLRTLVFQIIAVLVFPLLWGIDGIWLSIVFAELAAALITSLFLKKMQKRYHY